MKKIEGYEITINNGRGLSLDGIDHEMIAASDSQCLLRVPSVREIHALMTLAEKQGFQIDSIVPQRQTLEDLYLQQIKQ